MLFRHIGAKLKLGDQGNSVVTHPHHILNWYAGWSLVLAAFITGSAIGLRFYREDFWGGYASFRRRIVRLGHIALAALGMMNVVFSYSPWPAAASFEGRAASIAFVIGGISMPAVCFLAGWNPKFRHLFFIPVVALISAAWWTLSGAGN